MTPRRIRLMVAAFLGALPLTAAATWACTPLPRSFSVAPQAALAKTTTQVSGQGFAPGADVDVLWNGVREELIATARADNRGQFSLPVTVPNTSAGAYAIVFQTRSSDGRPSTVGRLPFRLMADGERSVGPVGEATPWAGDATVRGTSSSGGWSTEATFGGALVGMGAVALAGGSAAALTRRRRATADA